MIHGRAAVLDETSYKSFYKRILTCNILDSEGLVYERSAVADHHLLCLCRSQQQWWQQPEVCVLTLLSWWLSKIDYKRACSKHSTCIWNWNSQRYSVQIWATIDGVCRGNPNWCIRGYSLRCLITFGYYHSSKTKMKGAQNSTSTCRGV